MSRKDRLDGPAAGAGYTGGWERGEEISGRALRPTVGWSNWRTQAAECKCPHGAVSTDLDRGGGKDLDSSG